MIYFSHMRPNIVFVVNVVSQYMHHPFEVHLEAAYRNSRYLDMTPENGLFFKKLAERSVEAFTDAD